MNDYTFTRGVVLLSIAAAALYAADATWKSVQDLKTGSELRIYKTNAREPVSATFADATEDRVVILLKNEQTSIAKSDIDRIDARPPAAAKRKLNTSTTYKATDPDFTPHPQQGIPAPGTSSSTNVSMGSGTRPDFETVYRKVSGSGSSGSGSTQPHN